MKRSSQVALLLMGVTGVGAAAGGYMMTRPQHCIPPGSPAASAPALPGARALEPCPPSRGWAWFSGNDSDRSSSWTRTNRSSGSLWPVFSRRGTSATPSGSVPLSGRSAASAGVPRTSTSSSSTTRRGGFGSTSSSYYRSSS